MRFPLFINCSRAMQGLKLVSHRITGKEREKETKAHFPLREQGLSHVHFLPGNVIFQAKYNSLVIARIHSWEKHLDYRRSKSGFVMFLLFCIQLRVLI